MVLEVSWFLPLFSLPLIYFVILYKRQGGGGVGIRECLQESRDGLWLMHEMVILYSFY